MSLRVLIVEDEPLIALELEAIVEEAGHTVVDFVGSMHEALARADQASTDLAIVDINLSHGANGIETARRLRDEFGVRTLFTTALVACRAEAMDPTLDPVGFIAKPYTPKDITRALAKADRSPSA